MSFAVMQQISVTPEMTFFAEAESCEGEGPDQTLPDNNLKTTSKNYTLVLKEKVPISKEIKHFSQLFDKNGSAFSKTLSRSSPMQLASSISQRSFDIKKEPSAHEKTFSAPSNTVHQNLKGEKPALQKSQITSSKTLIKESSLQTPKTALQLKSSHKEVSEVKKEESVSRSQIKTEASKRENAPLLERQWSKEETKKWWELRYHQRERQGEGQKRDQNKEQHEKEEKKRAISKVAATSTKNEFSYESNQNIDREVFKKPQLPPPHVGVFALYYILTKIGIFSDGVCNTAYKKEVELIDTESTELHKKRIEELREAIKKEQETAQWSVANKVFSWMATLMAIIAGIVLIATGVGAVAGAMLIAGGLIQVTNQILEITGGWKKIAAILPGDDPEKKRAVITWMQIGIAVLCLILSGAGVIWGGYAHFGAVMSTASAMIGGFATAGHALTTIGEGITSFMYKDKIADIKKYEMRLTHLKHKRRDLMDQVESGVDRLEQLFEDLARSLQFDEELFMADQMAMRR